MNARLTLLGTVAPGVAESEVFRLALQHAVGELGALGGMIHLRGPMSALRLVSTAGLPPALTRSWEIIDQEGPLAPARALHEGGGVWVPMGAIGVTGVAEATGSAFGSPTGSAPNSPTGSPAGSPAGSVPGSRTGSTAGSAAFSSFGPVAHSSTGSPAHPPTGSPAHPLKGSTAGFPTSSPTRTTAGSPTDSTPASRAVSAPDDPSPAWPGTGLAALPMYRGRRSTGALSVLMGDQGEPGPEHWEFLRAVVAWTEERMVQAPPTAGPSRPAQPEQSGERLRQALKEVSVGSWDWNIQTGELLWDEAALELYGTRPEEYIGLVENWMRCVHPDDLAPTLALVDRAILEHGVFEAEYRVRKLDGSWGWTQARGRATYDHNGEPHRMIGVGWDSNEPRSARDALGRALRHMSDGFLAMDDDWRITFANVEAERTLGFSEEELFGRLLWDLPAAEQVPGLEIRCRQAAAAEKSVSFDVRLPNGRLCHLRLVPGPDGRTIYFTDVTEKRRLEEERRSAERAATERAARIAELTAALAKATTSKDVVDSVARRVLPPFEATGLVVQAVEGDRLHTVGSVGYPEDVLAFLDGRERTEPSPLWDAIISGTPLFLSSPREFAARYPELTDLPARAGKQAWALLPLTASGHTFGICAVSFDHPRRLTDEERTLLTATSALVAQALERARLFDAERTRSRELQRSLLPRDLPALPACTAAARYLPAGQGMDVGGDWYDIIPLSGGQVALVVGDVMGHGLPEAATMGRLRTAVHTLADLELPPDEIMSHLNDIVGAMGEESYVTCLYALYDSTTRVCSISRAGHPPPALLHPDGTVVFPPLPADPPLGAAEPPFETTEIPVPEGSVLALYTDGLVESSKREMDEGMAALADILRAAHADGTARDLEHLCERVTSALLPADHQAADDAAFLLARLHALPDSRMASWPLPKDPKAAGQARSLIRKQLTAWNLEVLTPTTELLASELVGNVIRHAKGPLRLRLLHGATLICEVFDGSLTMPRIRRATETDEGGRGLQLVTALSLRWGTRYTPTGKCIWTEQAVQPTPDAVRGDLDLAPDALEQMFLGVAGLGEDFDGDLDALAFGDQDF
ncbi:protein phosphatase [Streptomyces viridochromogenes]|uniref:protein-serine/threonine phosphatase n=1 Tax=Streptomyces viridochromogenes TaxID=1938 RepID=A0A0J8C6V6_STRVR|nr:SpoIIE family protein phosphatase [Streptomyces viridochromogenes]KMS73615.1 protein phosphatase [Streptomyces viridochromogenes]KOG07878.1 protein phosphatase [Streptomyces viridochromogenes]KOG28363.1 protein phosphatase [Streptomyces viridochromogenes]